MSSYEFGSFYKLTANPVEVGADSDGLDDYEERRIWESGPRSVDSDGDGIDDFPDPRITVRDRPPEITDVSTQNE